MTQLQRLTSLSSKAGWGCKAGPADLQRILEQLRLPVADERVLVGLGSPDDAGAFLLNSECALVQTVDFFTPIVDDPYAYGQIAAANALSDLYAMGARPLTALNLLGFPVGHMEDQTVSAILQGGTDKISEAQAVLLGGHTIDDTEPKMGYAVTGIAHPQQLLTKAAVQPGDLLLLTKPIGVGVLTTALKEGVLPDALIREITAVMSELNVLGLDLWSIGIRAATDVTGFGLLGHALEMARESHVALHVDADAVPLIRGVEEYAAQGLFPGGSDRNAAFVADSVQFAPRIAPLLRRLLVDAVTSGGLLIACPESSLAALQEAAERRNLPPVPVIGQAVAGPGGLIDVG